MASSSPPHHRPPPPPRVRDPQHNIRVTYLFTFFYWAARSILFQQVIAGFVFELTHSNAPVGVVKGVQGISQLVCSLPAGLVADRTRRDRVLRVAGALGLVAAGLTLVAVLECRLGLLNVAFGLWGLFAALQSPAMEAIFAESIPHGRRSYPFMIKHNVSNVAMVVGPLLSVGLFVVVGDRWRIAELQPVLAAGTALVAIASLVLFRFDDDQTLPDGADMDMLDHADDVDAKSDSESTAPPHDRPPYRRLSMGSDVLQTPSVVGNDLEIEYDYSDQEDSNDNCDQMVTDKPTAPVVVTEKSALLLLPVSSTPPVTAVRFLGLTPARVPHLLFLSDFIISNGAGMTVYFFPLFFKEEYGLSPIHVSLLFLFQPLVVMVLSFLGQRWSRRLGRMPIIVTTRLLATGCLLGMSYAGPLGLQVTLFLLRGGMMRCSQPLRRSVLMDHVRREVRARWNALEGISVFSYSGSAVLGGYLVDRYDYRTCFFVTSFVYFVGLSLELVLLPLTRHAVEK